MPSDDVKVTTVPFCTGVPADSMTTAVISAVPLVGSTVTLAIRRIVLLVGASSGTLSQPAAATAAARASRDGGAQRQMTCGGLVTIIVAWS